MRAPPETGQPRVRTEQPDVAEDQHDRRQDQREQADEFDDRTELGHLEPDPVGGGHDDDCADENGDEGCDGRIADRLQEGGAVEDRLVEEKLPAAYTLCLQAIETIAISF